jgi:hypothetical protein
MTLEGDNIKLEYCNWKDCSDYAWWMTECKEKIMLFTGITSKIKYCPFCGRLILITNNNN